MELSSSIKLPEIIYSMSSLEIHVFHFHFSNIKLLFCDCLVWLGVMRTPERRVCDLLSKRVGIFQIENENEWETELVALREEFLTNLSLYVIMILHVCKITS